MSKSNISFFSQFKPTNQDQAIHIPEGTKGSWRVKIIIFVLTIIIGTFFLIPGFNSNEDKLNEYMNTPGYIWPGSNLIADYNFPVYKNYNEYEKEKNEAASKTPIVFTYNQSVVEQSARVVELMIKSLQEINDDTQNVVGGFFTADATKAFLELPDQQRRNEIRKIDRTLKKFIENIYQNGFIDINVSDINSNFIAVHIPPNNEKVFLKANLFDETNFTQYGKDYLKSKLPENSAKLAIEILTNIDFPNLIYSEELTEEAKQIAMENIPRTSGIVRKGETIVIKGQTVDESTLLKLNSYEKTRHLHVENIQSFTVILGAMGHVTLIYSILVIYLFFIRRRILFDNLQVGILSGMIVFVGFLSWLSVNIPTNSFPLQFLVLIPSISMLAAILFDSRTAFYVTITISLFMAGIRGNDYDTMVSMIIAGTIAAYTVRDIQSRSQIYQSIFYVFLGFLFSIVAMNLERSTDFMTMLNNVLFGSLNAALSPLVTFGILYILEISSNITTDLQLQEFDNLSHPLLQKLNEIAPGTYQHTLSMANIAESCARAIGANPLLTKVGAYFHDVGKLATPEYFGENQMNSKDRHDRLTPRDSAEAIKQHVVGGIRLAEKYKIPRRITDFIPMHHGTSLIAHFYAKAVEEAGDEYIKKEDFRYPGPKPNTKETAIVMICDSAEAMSRIPTDDPFQFSQMIDKAIRDKLMDGQFDECNLTFAELQVVKETCLKALKGVSHPRVKYKEIPKEKQSEQEVQEKQSDSEINEDDKE
jgi:putative nucleotidyltransferase with HDIG domain